MPELSPAALQRLTDLDPHAPGSIHRLGWKPWFDAIAVARTALAEPELEGPTDEELEALADQFWVENSVNFEAEHYAFARAVLARWGRPVTPTAGEVGFSATWDTVAIIAQDMRARGLAEQAAGEELLKAATANRNRADSTTPPTPADEEVK